MTKIHCHYDTASEELHPFPGGLTRFIQGDVFGDKFFYTSIYDSVEESENSEFRMTDGAKLKAIVRDFLDSRDYKESEYQWLAERWDNDFTAEELADYVS